MKTWRLALLIVLAFAAAVAAGEDDAAGVGLEEVAFADIDAVIADSEGLVFVDLYADW